MKENELKEIFLAEALEGHEELNKLFTELEKDGKNKKAIESVFRITHTLKANAAGMGYDDIASISHTLEDVFSEIRTGKISIDGQIFNDLFRSIDMLGAMMNIIKDGKGEPIKYKGLKTKLEALVRNARFGPEAIPEDKTASSPQKETKKSKEIKTAPQVNENKEVQKINKDQPAEVFKELDDISVNEIANKVAFSDLVQIPIRKLDNLMNLVGELLIERDRIITLVNGSARKNEFTRLQRITSELQYSVMDVRLVQVNVLFNKFFRIVRDTAAIENKKVDLILEGTENEIDRNVLQIISDSLVHLVRNAVSHGIETPEERKKAGKSEVGKIHLRARSDKDAVIIEVQDDGKGINSEIIRRKAVEKSIISPEYARTLTEEECIYLIFEAGFSSAEQITAVSGRGVGTDVVKKAIDSIGGKIAIKTVVGQGSIFSLSLPSSMALKAALLFSLGNTEYAIPLTYTESVIQLTKNDIFKVGNGLVGTYLNRNISIIFLNDFLGAASKSEIGKKGTLDISYKNIKTEEKLYIVVVSCNNREIGFVVDKLHQQKEIVEKTLAPPLDKIDFVSGATILGNGNVCLVLDIPSIVNQFNKNLNFSK